MSDFTGLHPQIAKSNIAEFENTGMVIFYDLQYYNKLFMDSLSNVWWSPNAVEFGKEFTRTLYDSEADTEVLVNNTIVKCVEAYNTLAASNGLATAPDDHTIMSRENYAPQGTNMQYNDMKDIADNGDVGMDKEKVRAYLEEYANNISIVKAELDNFPINIAFYDPDGALEAAFYEERNKLKDQLEANYTAMANAISSRLIEEVDIVVAGAREAAGAMSGN